MHTLKVLILDSHPYQLMRIHQMLNACGVFDVLVADTTDLAWAALTRCQGVDLLICDVPRGPADAPALLQRAADQGLIEAVLLCSSADAQHVERTAVAVEALDFPLLASLSKPATIVALHRALLAYRAPVRFQLSSCRRMLDVIELSWRQTGQ